ncbi:hypothetical protein ALC56_03874 [Trachymyrmex septentrionalis]|uniref:Uncharacterized protein n=1 Tax=Trachymyrmex septentrionalis TaxID=34720 RepID=A0A195FMV2_9HYME|nr:hypothetical protein ALC56_03874 [Trachymyrmex septentrionalis]
MKITIMSFHYGESNSLSRSNVHTARNTKVCDGAIVYRENRCRLSSDDGGIEIGGKFGITEWSHNKTVPGRPLQMQPADIEIYWKTWSIPAGREYMPGPQVTRRGSEGSRVVE